MGGSQSSRAVAKFRVRMREEGFKKVEVWLSPELIEALDRLGAEQDRSRAWLTRRAVQNYVGNAGD
jgi:predicted DNA-binding protein